MRPLLALAAACALLVAAGAAAAEEAKNSTNKFRQREASDDMLAYPHLLAPRASPKIPPIRGLRAALDLGLLLDPGAHAAGVVLGVLRVMRPTSFAFGC